MKDFYRLSLIGRGGPIVPTTVPETDFVLNNHMVQLLRKNYQFHGFEGEDANEHLDKYLSITQFIKQNKISQDIINLNIFPFSLTHRAESWFYTLKTHSIHTWEEMVSKFLSKYYPYSKALQLRKDIFNFQQLPTETVFEAWEDSNIVYGNNSDFLLEETDAFLGLDSIPPRIDSEIFDAEGDILLLEKLLNIHSIKDLPPQELNNDSEEDIIFLEKLLEDEPLEAKKSEIDPLTMEPSHTILIGDKEIKFNPLKDIDDPVPIPKVSEKPLDSLNSISETFKITITNPLFDIDSEFTLNSENPIFDIQNEESDESNTETIIEEVQIHSS
nr:reverse transcriptase domain-containing protein [Tanacetum cinerariifolium]